MNPQETLRTMRHNARRKIEIVQEKVRFYRQQNKRVDELLDSGQYERRLRTERAALGVGLILLMVFAITGLFAVMDYVGYVSYHAGRGGYIYELVLEHHAQTTDWAALYGVAVQVSGFDAPQVQVITGGDTLEANLLFPCMQKNIEHEIYASFVPQASIDFGSVVPATPADVDAYLNKSAFEITSGTNTFLSNISFALGSASFTTPGTYTYKANETPPSTFKEGVLKDGNGHLIFVAIVTNFTNGFNGRTYNYQLILPAFNTTSSVVYLYEDPNDLCPGGQGEQPDVGFVTGNVTDTTGNPISGAIVEVAGSTTASNAQGFYNLSTAPGIHNIYGIKAGYQVYRNNITVISINTTTHNIVLSLETIPNPFTDVGPGISNAQSVDIGPGVSQAVDKNKDVGPGQAPPVTEQPQQIEGQDYIITVAEIKRKMQEGNFIQERIIFYSFKKTPATLIFSINGTVSDMIQMDKSTLTIDPKGKEELLLTIFANKAPGVSNGTLSIDGSFNATIPIEIEVLSKQLLDVQALFLQVDPITKELPPSSNFKFKTDLHNLLSDQQYPVQLIFTAQDIKGNRTLWTDQFNVNLKTSFSLLRGFTVPANAPPGDYILRVTASYL